MVKTDVKPEVLFPVKCAWCRKTTDFSTIGNSHSICRKCSNKLLAKMLTERASRP